MEQTADFNTCQVIKNAIKKNKNKALKPNDFFGFFF